METRKACPLWFAAASLAAFGAARAAAGPAGGEILQASGVSAGLAVRVGTTDGALEAELTSGGKLLVQGLAISDDAAAQARKALFEKNLYPLASVSVIKTAASLPYYDRTVNLLIADLDALGKDAPAAEEIQRVLGYGGVAYLKKGGSWAKSVKPTPSEIDAWTHARHNASRNATSKDLIVGPPNALRWLGGLTGRASVSGPRTSDGVFVQYAPPLLPAGQRGGDGICLWARDVNSGVLLWKREVSPGMPVIDYVGWSDYTVGDLLVAAGGRVYTYDLTKDPCALTAFNLRTGEIEKVFDKSVTIRKTVDPRNKNVILSPESRRALTRSTVAVEAGKVIQLFDKNLYVMDAAGADVIWKKEPAGGAQYRYVVAGDGLLIAARGQARELSGYRTADMFFAPEALECYQLQDGKPLWTFTDFKPDLEVMHDLFALSGGYLPLVGAPEGGGKGKTTVVLLDARKGTVVWKKPLPVDFDHQRQRHLRILGGDLWYHPFPSTSASVCLDLLTGAEKRKVSSGRNRGCSGHTATPKYLILQKIFVPLGEAAGQAGAPKYYALRCFNPYCAERLAPSYGSVYNLLSICPCETYIPGSAEAFYAVPPAPAVPDAARREGDRGGKALGALPRQTAQQTATAAMDWKDPAGYRLGTRRFPDPRPDNRGFAPGCYDFAWTGYRYETSRSVEAGDLVLTAIVHEHRLAASRAGREVWNFVAGGRISEPPAIYSASDKATADKGDLALFGSHDGYVYAVKVNDGSLAWRFLAAPADRRHVVFGQIESAWPVFNVALHDGKAYFAAGRHSDLDGGIHIYCVDAATGAARWHVKYQRGLSTDKNTPFGARDPSAKGKTGKNVEFGNTYVINDPIEVRGGKIAIRVDVPDPNWDEKTGRRKEGPANKSPFPYDRYKEGTRPGYLRYPDGEVILVEDIANPKDTIVNPDTLIPPGIAAPAAPVRR